MSYDADSRMLTVRAEGKPTAPSSAELTHPNGTKETISFSGGSWTDKVKKRGNYTVSAVAPGEGGQRCEASHEVVRRGGGGGTLRGDDRFTIRGFLGPVDVDDDNIFTSIFRPNGVNERSDFKVGTGEAFGVELEYHITDRHGAAFALIAGNLDADFLLDLDNAWEADSDDLGFLMGVFSYNYHLTPDKKADFFIGPALGIFQPSDVSFLNLGERNRRSFDDEVALGVQLGLDLWLNEAQNWGFYGGARYFDLGLELDRSDADIDLNPLFLLVGVSHRF